MLVRHILTLTNYSLYKPFPYFLSQYKDDILSSKYHLIGPTHFKKGRNIQKLLSSQLHTIDSIQSKLNSLRTSLHIPTNSPSQTHPSQLTQYINQYQKLVKTIQQCEINNEWIYNIISWYNMTPLYLTLLERLLNSKKEEIYYLVQAMHSMKFNWKLHQQQIQQIYSRNNNITQFYKKLHLKIQIQLLVKIEQILRSPISYHKRRFYQRYLQDNLEFILKNIKTNDASSITELIWLFEAFIKAMNDDEVLISKIEKYIVTTRMSLSNEDMERLMNAYSLKGKINQQIYNRYIIPYILNQKMKNPDHIVQSFRFLVACQMHQHQLFTQLLQNLKKIKQPHTLHPQSLRVLHIYTHYLRIKGQEVKFNKGLQAQLKKYCKGSRQGKSIGALVNEVNKKRSFQYRQKLNSSLCINLQEQKLQKLNSSQMRRFQQQFGYRLVPLSLKKIEVFKDTNFCCFGLDYCIHSRGTSQIYNMQTNSIEYIFSSGQLTREAKIRDQILNHYGIKTHYLNSSSLKSKGRMSEESYLINYRVSFSK